MPGHNKDVMVYRFDPKKKYFLISLRLENKPGELGNIANLLGIRGINILEGFFGAISTGEQGVMGFFVESTNERLTADWLKDFLNSSVGVSDVEVKTGVEGFLTDSLNFPVTWNNGDRAVLMRVEGLRAMMNAVRDAGPDAAGASLYAQGRSYGIVAWRDLFAVHMPKTKEGLAEMLRIYFATGWGRVELQALDLASKKAYIRVDEGFECGGLDTGKPESNFMRGHLSGAMSVFFGEEVRATETKCVSKGDPHCEFMISQGAAEMV